MPGNALVIWPEIFNSAQLTFALEVATNGTIPNTSVLAFPAAGSLTADRFYWMSADGLADLDFGFGGQGDLLALFKATLETHPNIATATPTINALGKLEVAFTFSDDSTGAQFNWGAGATTLDATLFGWPTGAGTLISNPQVSPNRPRGRWYANDPISRPDSRDRQGVIGGRSDALSGTGRTVRYGLPKKDRRLTFAFIPQAYALEEFKLADDPFGTFETFWLQAATLGHSFRLYKDEGQLGTSDFKLYSLRGDQAFDDTLEQHERWQVWWGLNLPMWLERVGASP